MEIEFNTGGINQPDSSQSINRRSATPPASDPVSFSSSNSLDSQMSKMSTVRPEQVAKAKALLAGGDYPNDETLGKLAGHLASQPGTTSSTQAS
jgi:hypothetical protein